MSCWSTRVTSQKIKQQTRRNRMSARGFLRMICVASGATALLGGCTVGPKYHTPSAPTPTAYKELTPANFPTTDGWRVAQPKDDELRGKWWEIYNDPQLNALEDQIDISNQSIAAAAASFFSARAMVKEARSQYFPTLSTNPSISQIRQSASLRTFSTGSGVAEQALRRTSRSLNITFHLTLAGNRTYSERSAIQCVHRCMARRRAPPTWRTHA
jgi:outer membrane protein TolC